jgi:predicted transposase/invertase (TIGR01784 family)
MGAILDDRILLQIEGSERFMLKLSEEVLLEEREEGRMEGRVEGRTEGSEEKARAIAKNMLKRNRPIDEIVEDTGLTREEILSLNKTNKT